MSKMDFLNFSILYNVNATKEKQKIKCEGNAAPGQFIVYTYSMFYTVFKRTKDTINSLKHGIL